MPGSRVCTVTWDELPDVEMRDFTIATMPARFAALGDLHAGIDDAVWQTPCATCRG
jgi:DNA primase